MMSRHFKGIRTG